MDFKFEFKRHQTNKIPRDKILAELENFARINNFTDFKQDDFNKHASISSYTVYREFGSWENAMQSLAEYLKNKGIDFKISTRRSSYGTQELFDEMERIWVLLGHRPSRNEWTAIKPKISYDSLYRRFGGWTNACLKFIEYKSGGAITAGDEVRVQSEKAVRKADARVDSQKEMDKVKKELQKTRTIPLSVRIKVLSRDNFRCVFCGKSPAINAGTLLHIDHIVPFSKGGINTIDNLQTLCEECNLGKSDEKL